MFVLEEVLEKARAFAHKLEGELRETKRQLIGAKKEVQEQQNLVNQLLDQAAPVKKQEQIDPMKKEESKKDLMVVVHLPKKIEGRGRLDGSAPGRAA